MEMLAGTADWRGPGSHFHRALSRGTRFKRAVLAGRYERSRLTAAGALFVGITLALGTAAYNASNNLLFLALSLLLSCLILNGVLAWVNFGGAAWRLRIPARMRAGEASRCAIEVANARRWTPLCALFFEVKWQESKDARWIGLRQALAPQSTTLLTWDQTPTRRGRAQLTLGRVGSLFPFGFLRKAVLAETETEVLVHPARVSYSQLGVELRVNDPGLRSSSHRGEGTDLLTLRPYRPGDAPKSVHWKATARSGRLIVRDTAQDTDGQVEIRFDLSSDLWTAEQFEQALSFAATLAEDLHRAGRLRSFRFAGQRSMPIRKPSDFQQLLDDLAVVTPSSKPPEPPPHSAASVISFLPKPGRIEAILHGKPIAEFDQR
ncbi:MAG: DUF58 domain-containing protein [Opitutaceae bacterium]|nr:DUF58 domain-containing protein [Opitutaceae bacterium]